MGCIFMKCKYYVFGDNNSGYSICIDANSLILQKNGEIENLSASEAQCFNTLISLFSLKNNWIKKDCLNPIYRVDFECDGKKEIYVFDIASVPSNWLMFVGYISKLVGDNL